MVVASGTSSTTLDEDVEKARLAAVRKYKILDTPPDGAFDRVAALAARVFEVPIATVSIVDHDRIWFKAAQGLPERVQQIGRDPGLCASAILQDEPYVLPDTLREPHALGNPLVRGKLGIRFYAAAPIITPDGHRLGTVNVLDTKPRKVAAKSIAILKGLAAVITEQLEMHLAALETVAWQESNMQTALQSRANTDRAVGMIMLARRCDADSAWNMLRDISQRANVKVRAVAETMCQIVGGINGASPDETASQVAWELLCEHPRRDPANLE